MLLKPAKPARGPARRVLPRLQQGVRPRRPTATSRAARILVRRSILTIGIVASWSPWAPASSASALPAGFIPEEDQGIFGVNVTAARRRVARAHERGAGPGRGDPRQDRGRRVVPDDRRLRRRHQHLPAELRHDLRPPEAVGRAARRGACTCSGDHGPDLRPRSRRIPEAIIFPFNIPTISGFGASAGFNFLLQDRSGSLSVERLGELSRAVPGGRAQAAGDRQHLHLVRPALSRR